MIHATKSENCAIALVENPQCCFHLIVSKHDERVYTSMVDLMEDLTTLSRNGVKIPFALFDSLNERMHDLPDEF